MATSTGAIRKVGSYCVAYSAQKRSSCTSPCTAHFACHLTSLNQVSRFTYLRGRFTSCTGFDVRAQNFRQYSSGSTKYSRELSTRRKLRTRRSEKPPLPTF